MKEGTKKSWWAVGIGIFWLFFCCSQPAVGAGILTPRGSDHQPIRILDHHVNVTINNGYARTEVIQTFFNPNDMPLEAVYSFPLPESASLSEVTIYVGEKEMTGEVVPRDRAAQLYEEERSQGGEAGLAEKNEFYTFEFTVYPVRPLEETRIRFLYYQPLEIDLGVGRYLYPLEEGGTDEEAMEFWTGTSQVDKIFSMKVELDSAWPIADLRMPGFESAAEVDKKSDGRYTVKVERHDMSLDRDFILYYRLEDNLPGRVELIPYRSGRDDEPGTFMMVLTPGLDLKPLANGADYTFVLDVSGSMDSKINVLGQGVSRAVREMKNNDMFRIITFESSARDLTRGSVRATDKNKTFFCREVENLSSGGSTNLYAGLRLALKSLDDDRATSIVLVTDAVTNTGIISTDAFFNLMKSCDVRVFGFLLGNSGNWPLMRVICEESGGFSAGISNSDDIIGQLMLAKSKIRTECLHNAELSIKGIEVSQCTDGWLGKVYQGQQLVIFGRYERGGRARISLKGRITGRDVEYRTEFDFPEIDTAHPEIERLWALDRIERLEHRKGIGEIAPGKADQAIEELGIRYQLVTDQTSMVILSDERFRENGIDRKNRQRIAREEEARAAGNSVQTRRVDKEQPMFPSSAPSPRRGGKGGGALDPASVGISIGIACLAARALRRRKGGRRDL